MSQKYEAPAVQIRQALLESGLLRRKADAA